MKNMLKNEEFLKKYNIASDDFDKTGLKWDELLKIGEDYELLKNDLEPIAKFIIESLYALKKAHSVKYRIKNTEHLLSKIIRKRIESPEEIINIENYKEKITDLIGIRILYLFEEDWIIIDEFIKKHWNFLGNPTAYIKNGDDSEKFKKNGCNIEIHPSSYRSVHYLVEVTPFKDKSTVEIQTRTIFQEGWSEIDHLLRYPNQNNDLLLNNFLNLFSGFAGNADKMGSFIKNYKIAVEEREELFNKENIKLKEKIEKLKIDVKEKEELYKSLNDVNKFKLSTINNHDYFSTDLSGNNLMDSWKINTIRSSDDDAISVRDNCIYTRLGNKKMPIPDDNNLFSSNLKK